MNSSETRLTLAIEYPSFGPVAAAQPVALGAPFWLSCVNDLGQFLGLLIMQRLLQPGIA